MEANDLRQAAAKWANETISSHAIYATSVLESLPEGLYYDAETARLCAVVDGKIRFKKLHARTVAFVEQNESMEATGNPKAAQPFDPDVDRNEWVVDGGDIAYALDMLLTGEDGGGHLLGRGFAFRARVAHLAGG